MGKNNYNSCKNVKDKIFIKVVHEYRVVYDLGKILGEE